MALVDEKMLGTGYKLYVDNFYTSPSLFRDLLKKGVWACGTIRSSRVGFPQTTANKMAKNAPHGSMRCNRDNSLLFVQWNDTREVHMCSSFHAAEGDRTVRRRLKTRADGWTELHVPIPDVVHDYNQHMGGNDLSDALVGYYQVLRKTRKWYCSLFFHFVDIAVVNAFILHQQFAAAHNQSVKSQREFREALVIELADWTPQSEPAPRAPPAPTTLLTRHVCHRPKPITDKSDDSRRRCQLSHQKATVLCQGCAAYFCFQAKRDCFNNWHDANNL